MGALQLLYKHNSGTSPTNYTYMGQYSYTGSFGLMYYREASRAASRRAENARWYDPARGRFAQADSIVPPGVHPISWGQVDWIGTRTSTTRR
ncbi:MAG: hypothetical protein HS100_18915 [Anaerolineales bacterium]|nr:hypothetical protein [Anaerolineales bacterium]